MTVTNPGAGTLLLHAWARGDVQARDDLFDLVHRDLRARAAGYLRRERRDHTLQPTALIHETYLRLVDQDRVDWQNRAHFLAIAAKMMRRVLVDHARRRKAALMSSNARGEGCSATRTCAVTTPFDSATSSR